MRKLQLDRHACFAPAEKQAFSARPQTISIPGSQTCRSRALAVRRYQSRPLMIAFYELRSSEASSSCLPTPIILTRNGPQQPGHCQSTVLSRSRSADLFDVLCAGSRPRRIDVNQMTFKFPVGTAVEYRPQGLSAGVFKVVRHMPE